MAGKMLIVANWKMHPRTYRDAKLLLDATKRLAAKYPKVSLVVAPPALFLRDLAASQRGRKIALSSQDARAEAEGPHTGSVSLAQAKDCGATHVLIGHAECRARGERDEDVQKKVASALALGMTAIVCVGEEMRDASGAYLARVREQIRAAVLGAPEGALKRLIIAYEPVWAIGKEEAMAPRDMHEMSLFVRKVLAEKWGEAAHAARVLYGGSLSEKNARGMMEEGYIEGFLLGRASIEPNALRGVFQEMYPV